MAISRESGRFTDADWVRDIFCIGKNELDGMPIETRVWSSADFKFIDTGLGGSLVINPLPQPNHFTDPVSQDSLARHINSDGIGPYFSETFDDHYRVISFRAGTMAFTSLLSFITGMYSPAAASLANKGRVHAFMFSAGKVFAGAVQLLALPYILVGLVGKAINFFANKPSERYAYLKPNMPLYWSTVQTMVNHFMVNLGLTHLSAPTDLSGNKMGTGQGQGGLPEEIPDSTTRDLSIMRELYPEIFTANGFQSMFLGKDGVNLDVSVIANRANRLAYLREQKLSQALGQAPTKALLDRVYSQGLHGPAPLTLSQYIQKWQSAAPYKPPTGTPETDGDKLLDATDIISASEIQDAGFKDLLLNELRDGSAFISFRVDDTGPVSESFSNTFKQSTLAEKFNSMSSTFRSTAFNMAGGNIGDGPLSNLFEAAVGGIKGLVEGTLAGIGLEGLLLVGGGGTVDMPQYWESSEVSLPKPGYSFKLRSRYANPYSRLVDILFPLACFLALAMNISAGKHSHTSPFYLEFYDKGRMQSRLAAIDSVTITRGEGTIGFTPDCQVLGIDVSFSIQAMEETIAMPVSEGFSLTENLLASLGGAALGSLVGPGGTIAGAIGGSALNAGLSMVKGVFDDDTPFMDYMAVLTGMGYQEQIYATQKLKRRIAYNKQNIASSFSAQRMAGYTVNTFPGDIAKSFYLATR